MLIGILILLAIVLGLILLSSLLIIDIHRIIADLDYIQAHETNALVSTNSNLSLSRQLVSRLNQLLIRSRKLKINQHRDEQRTHKMLTNLTHDIKTPLTVASGYSQILTTTGNQSEQPKLRKITRNLQTVDHYLSYLMDFNLLQERMRALKLAPTDLTQVIQTHLFNMYDAFDKQGLAVHLALTPNLTVPVDKLLFDRVLNNLIGNILKYGQDDVTISTSKNDTGQVNIVFTNSTDQPPTGHDEHLLTRFTSYDQQPQRSSQGLGLNIVQSAMLTMGGRLKVKSQPKENLFTVQLILPVSQPRTSSKAH